MRKFDTKRIKSRPLCEWGSHRKTGWVVITGAACSGKTTVIEELSNRGYFCVREVARDHFNAQISAGYKNHTIRANEARFQVDVTNKKLQIEAKLNPDDHIFLDRGMPDSITYYRLAGIDPDTVVDDCMRFRYKLVFIFHQLHHVTDNIRTESEEENNLIQKWLKKDYESLGYKVIDVPVMSVKDRIVFVLTKIRESQ